MMMDANGPGPGGIVIKAPYMCLSDGKHAMLEGRLWKAHRKSPLEGAQKVAFGKAHIKSPLKGASASRLWKGAQKVASEKAPNGQLFTQQLDVFDMLILVGSW